MLKLLNRGIDYLQEKFPPNRVVVLLTPLVFVPVSAVVSAWVAKHFPGVNLSPVVIGGAAAAGALSALATAYKWIDGWQKHEGQFH
jgi:hypothetical protein